MMRILAVDPAVVNYGLAVVEVANELEYRILHAGAVPREALADSGLKRNFGRQFDLECERHILYWRRIWHEFKPGVVVAERFTNRVRTGNDCEFVNLMLGLLYSVAVENFSPVIHVRSSDWKRGHTSTAALDGLYKAVAQRLGSASQYPHKHATDSVCIALNYAQRMIPEGNYFNDKPSLAGQIAAALENGKLI